MSRLVDTMPGSAQARERATVILRTLSREWSVQAGCVRLGVGRTRFQDLRQRLLLSAVNALEERAAGRPRKPTAHGQRKSLLGTVAELEHELARAKTELEIARGAAAKAVATRLAAKGGRR